MLCGISDLALAKIRHAQAASDSVMCANIDRAWWLDLFQCSLITLRYDGLEMRNVQGLFIDRSEI